jgi:hypothetical protein
MMSDMSDRMMGKINGMVDKMTQTINSHSESIVKIETYEDEPSPTIGFHNNTRLSHLLRRIPTL